MDIQQSSETDTTSIMNKYNFVKPLTVTVIYEEDEEKVKEINVENRNVYSMLNQEINNRPLLASPSNIATETTAEFSKPEEKDNYKMLLKVAKNMSDIVEAHNKYVQCIKRNEKEATVLKFHYIHTKSRNYRRSFEVACRLLFLLKTNERLKQFLIQKIIGLTKVRLTCQIDYKYVKVLYNDFIFWTEEMKNKMLSTRNLDNINPVRDSLTHPVTKAQNVSNNLKRKSNQDNSSKENKVTIFSAGPKGNEVTISVDTQYLYTTLHIDKSNDRTSYQNETPKPKENVSTSINNISRSVLYHFLQTKKQCTNKRVLSQRESINGNTTIKETISNNSIPRSCPINDTNTSIRTDNVDNSNINSLQQNTIALNTNQKQDSTKHSDKSDSLSFQALMDHMNSVLYTDNSETNQRAYKSSYPLLSTYRTNNAVTTHYNINKDTNQNQMHIMNKNTYPVLNTSGNMTNYPTTPLRYNSGTHVPQRTNLHCNMITVNQYRYENYVHCNYTNTLPGCQENYLNNLIGRGQQTNQQHYIPENHIKRR